MSRLDKCALAISIVAMILILTLLLSMSANGQDDTVLYATCKYHSDHAIDTAPVYGVKIIADTHYDDGTRVIIGSHEKYTKSIVFLTDPESVTKYIEKGFQFVTMCTEGNKLKAIMYYVVLKTKI